jgi:hypothetical protein
VGGGVGYSEDRSSRGLEIFIIHFDVGIFVSVTPYPLWGGLWPVGWIVLLCDVYIVSMR